MKIQGPTIVAYIIFAFSMLACMYVNTCMIPDVRENNKDVEITIKNTEKASLNTDYKEVDSYWILFTKRLRKKLDSARKTAFNIIDSYQYELADGWREILNTFEIFEYCKALPEAFIRRLIFMPTLTGNKEYCEEEVESKPRVYPDTDYRSFKYRTAFVANVIDGLKAIVDLFYNVIKSCLG